MASGIRMNTKTPRAHRVGAAFEVAKAPNNTRDARHEWRQKVPCSDGGIPGNRIDGGSQKMRGVRCALPSVWSGDDRCPKRCHGNEVRIAGVEVKVHASSWGKYSAATNPSHAHREDQLIDGVKKDAVRNGDGQK